MLKKITLLFVLFSIFILNAQNCGTVSRSLISNLKNPLISCIGDLHDFNNKTYCVNVKFHIVNFDDGTKGIDPSKVQNIVNKLNEVFNYQGITIMNKGFDYINNTNLSINTGSTNPQLTNILFNTNKDLDAINYYIVRHIYDYSGYANIGFVAITDDFVDKYVSIHEFGHALGLLHTHECRYPTYQQGCAENINGSNCTYFGDQVCDTPADSKQGVTNGFNPDMTNFMSYYGDIRTLDHFTSGQGTRMRNTINCYLQNILSYKCAIINGSSNICLNSNSNFIFSTYFGKPNVIWSVTPNLQIISALNSPPNFSAIIKGISNGSGIITATFPNGESITKTVWVGVPKVSLPIDCDLATPTTQNCYSICKQVQMTTGNYVNVEAQGLDINSGYAEWEWQKITNNFDLTPYENSAYINPLWYLSPQGWLGYRVRAKNACGWSEWFENYLTILYCDSASGGMVNSKSSNTIFAVFPNPSKDFVYVDLINQNNLPEKNSLISGELFDLMGQSKSKIEIKNNKAIFSVIGLNKGIFVLKIYINSKIETHQIIIE